MDLERILRMSDKEIVHLMRQAPPLPHPQAVRPEQFLYVPTQVLLSFLEGNYRTHTFKFTHELGDSIQKYGQLEPILFTQNGMHLTDTDGRGRFWSNFAKGADYMPVQIMYDVPELLKLEMEIDLNATKTKIDNEDIALLAQDIFQGLVDEYSLLSDDGTRKIITPKAKQKALALTAQVMCRDKNTLRKYLTVANIHPQILADNKERRSAQSFERLFAIAKTFESPKEQQLFYDEMKKQEAIFAKRKEQEIMHLHVNNEQKKKKKIEKLTQSETILPKNSFYALLHRMKDEATQQSFLLTTQARQQPLNKQNIYQAFTNLKHYLLGTTQLLRRFPDLKEGLKEFSYEDKDTTTLIADAKDQIKAFTLQAHPLVVATVERYLKKNKGESFEEVMQRKTASKQNEVPLVVHSVSDTIEYIPLEQIVIDDEQLRSRYNKQAIRQLAEKINKYGQIKPGMVYKIGEHEGKPLYKVIVGNSRFQGCQLANTGFYKAFVCNDIKEYEIKIYQAIEDMFEQDTLLERSAMLHRRFALAKKKAHMHNQSLTIDDFLHEHRYLGIPSKLKKIMSLIELPSVYQDMIKAQLITPDGALAVNSLPEQYQMEVLFPLMTNPKYKRSLRKEVRKKQETLHAEKNGFTQLKMMNDDEFASFISYKKFYEELSHKISSIPQLYNQLRYTNGCQERFKKSKGFHLTLAKTYEALQEMQQELLKSSSSLVEQNNDSQHIQSYASIPTEYQTIDNNVSTN